MRAAMFNGPGRPITIESMDDPRPGTGDVLVRVHRCGICGSDVSMSSEGPMTLPLGRFGHEWAGEVLELGNDVRDVRVGTRIAGLPVARCGRCEGCRTGNPLHCETSGWLVGGFGEFMVIPKVAAMPLPDALSFTDGALVEPMACGLHALRLAQMRPGNTVLVIGAGAMALSVIYWARNLGAGRIAVLSRSAHRHDVAMTMGASTVSSFDDQDRIAETLGAAPDIVAECVGKSGMLELASSHVRTRGTILSLGMCQYGDPVVPAICTHKEVRILFPRGYTVDEFEETARSFDSGRLNPGVMVSDTITLEELPGVMEKLRSGARKSLKVHVDPRKGVGHG